MSGWTAPGLFTTAWAPGAAVVAPAAAGMAKARPRARAGPATASFIAAEIRTLLLLSGNPLFPPDPSVPAGRYATATPGQRRPDSLAAWRGSARNGWSCAAGGRVAAA